ncbi:tetratricopeptide repeat protein [Geobacter sp. OR-1]|uniref:tetratricopeptide repeat protein n=1 Tax=Geobacter sp. OR-1 TaxID=1266765 RepID=UPI000541DB66|nr:tetratricopeptide repeat protein [Geobacter sp. OR-1]GAM09703.1 tetratricopeptide repeat protein [Geobacter sp. OR-1]
MARRRFILSLAALALTVIGNPIVSAAETPSRLRRIDIKPRPDYTRLIFQLDRETPHSVTELPGNRLKLTFPLADAPMLRRLRNYADHHVKGITVAQRGERLQVTVGMTGPGEGLRLLDSCSQTLTLDIGPRFRNVVTAPPMLAGREPIWAGTGKFVREYDPPIRSELPFVPTDQQSLRAQLSEEETRQFLMGEAAIYKGQSSDAVGIFNAFMQKDSGIRALAAYRCGQAYYCLLEYERALQLFKYAESIWPQFLDMSADVKFAYADCLVRGGDLPAGRRLLSRLIASKAEKKTAPILLVRLADILSRQKQETESRVIYGNVIRFFPDNKAAVYAALKLADRRFPEIDSYGYQGLRDEYLRIARVSGDFIVREEAFFKAALLESLFGRGIDALTVVADYEKRYPRGIMASLALAMHLDLMPIVYSELKASGDAEQMVRIMDRHADYLAKCLSEPAFVVDLDQSFTKLGLKQDENRLFGRLVRRDWAVQQAPFLYGKMLENSIALSDWDVAESTGREFVRRFPLFNDTKSVREVLGDIGYRKGDMKSVKADLAFLLDPKQRADKPESYYYLGKSFEAGKDVTQAGRAMELFIAAVNERRIASPLLADAYFVAGSSSLASRNNSKAMAYFTSGLGQAPQEGRDRFLFRIGELSKKQGQTTAAKKSWQKIVQEGSDPVWQRLASQELADLEWKERIGADI